MRIYRELIFMKKYIKKNKWLLYGGATVFLVSAMIAPIPYVIGYILDTVILEQKSYKLLVVTLLGLVCIYFIKTFATFFYHICFIKAQQEIMNSLRLDAINHIMGASQSYLNSKDKGYIWGRYCEIQQISALFSPQVISNMLGILELVFYIVIMFVLNYTLAIIALLFIPIYFNISLIMSKKVMNSSVIMNETYSQLSGELFETFNGIEDIKLLNAKEKQTQKIRRKLLEFSRATYGQNRNMTTFVQLVVLVNDVIGAIILGVSGFLILNNSISVGLYTSFSLYVSKILMIIQNLGSMGMTFKTVCVSISRIKELLNIKAEDQIKGADFYEPIENIEFENVYFKYREEEKYIINNLSYALKAGDILLIKGPNGSGKTTITKLLTGLYAPNSGKILINGNDLAYINKTHLRNHIGIVTQNVFLFKGTVLENILFGAINKTSNDVKEIINNYGLNEYLNRLPFGVKTEILQNGLDISGGQRQMVAFLRAIIRNSDILILDEATSNLDKEANQIILDTIQKYNIAKITVIISHQNEGNIFANKILDMETNNISLYKSHI